MDSDHSRRRCAPSRGQSNCENAITTSGRGESTKCVCQGHAFDCVLSSDISRWNELIRELPTWKPRREYKELDRLFRDDALIYHNVDQAIFELRAALDSRPAWNLAKGLLAVALEESAQEKGYESLAHQALQEMNAPMSVADDNPFVILTVPHKACAMQISINFSIYACASRGPAYD